MYVFALLLSAFTSHPFLPSLPKNVFYLSISVLYQSPFVTSAAASSVSRLWYSHPSVVPQQCLSSSVSCSSPPSLFFSAGPASLFSCCPPRFVSTDRSAPLRHAQMDLVCSCGQWQHLTVRISTPHIDGEKRPKTVGVSASDQGCGGEAFDETYSLSTEAKMSQRHYGLRPQCSHFMWGKRSALKWTGNWGRLG